MSTLNRKRSRSDDNSLSMQNKIFVDQKFLNEQNEEKMKQIHGKTINLLFQGIKNLTFNNNNNNNKNEKLSKLEEIMCKVRLLGNGQIQFNGGIKPLGFPENLSKSKCCNKNALIHSECVNCNLQLCENCGYSCSGCGIFLCGACVSIFGCGTFEEPTCSNCQMYS